RNRTESRAECLGVQGRERAPGLGRFGPHLGCRGPISKRASGDAGSRTQERGSLARVTIGCGCSACVTQAGNVRAQKLFSDFLKSCRGFSFGRVETVTGQHVALVATISRPSQKKKKQLTKGIKDE